MASAFDRDDCSLFHLRSATDITKINKEDHFEAVEALRRLGISSDDLLFYKGNVFVEGQTDIDLLNEGFFEKIAGFKLAQLSGRQEIEKEILNLQASEKNDKLDRSNVFIFDNDNRPSKLVDTQKVKIRQWDRYCLENYLIDETPLFNVIKELNKDVITSRGEFKNDLKQLAFQQLNELAIGEAYRLLEPDNAGLRPKEIANKTFEQAAATLAARLTQISESLKDFEVSEWKSNFVSSADAKLVALSDKWEIDWEKSCDGKRLMNAIHQKYKVGVSHGKFKKLIMREMKRTKSEQWKILDSTLADALKGMG